MYFRHLSGQREPNFAAYRKRQLLNNEFEEMRPLTALANFILFIIMIVVIIIFAKAGMALGADHGVIWEQGGANGVQNGDNIWGNDSPINPHGVYGNGNAEFSLGHADRVTVVVHAEDADGVRTNPAGTTNWTGGNVKITLGDNWTIITKGLSGDGLNVNGGDKAGNLVKVGNGLTIITEYAGALGVKEGAHGVRANFHGNIEIGDDLNVTTYGERSYGIYGAQGRGLGITDGVTIDIGNQAVVATMGKGSHAAVLESKNGVITIKDAANFTTNGINAYAVSVSGENSRFEMGRYAQLVTIGDNAHAVYNNGKNAIVQFGESSQIHTAGYKAYGVYSYGATTANTITLGEFNAISTLGQEAHGVYMYATDGVINLGRGSQVVTGGAGAHALYAHGSSSTILGTTFYYGANGKIIVDDMAYLSTSGTGAYSVYVDWETSSIEFKGGSDVYAAGADSYAFYAHDGKITSTLDESGNVVSGGRFNIVGNMKASGTGLLDLWLGVDSVFTGRTEQDGGTINLTLESAEWNVIGNSVLHHLSLIDGTVNFTRTNEFVTLEVDSLSGNGKFIFNTDIQGVVNDLLVVNGEVAHNNDIHIQNNGAVNTHGGEILTLVVTGGGDGVFALGHDAVELGGFVYRLRQNGNNWELHSGRDTLPPGPDPEPEPELSGSADISINSFAAAYLLNYADTQSLLQRLGDLRSNGNAFGVWGRGYAGKFTSAGSEFLRGFKMNYYGAQAGLDYQLLAADNPGRLYAGVMAGYILGDLNHFAGKGKIDMKTVGVYATYLHNGGLYADLVLKYGFMENDLNVTDTQGQKVSGRSMRTGSYSAALEVGKRLHLNAGKQGLYVEPQAQLSYTHTASGDVKASNGLKIKTDAYDSILGRLGTNVGYETAIGEDTKINLYAKASYVHEFDGDIGVRLNNASIKESFGGDWVTYGVGATLQVAEKHNFYADFEAAAGGQFSQPWSVNVGYRYTF